MRRSSLDLAERFRLRALIVAWEDGSDLPAGIAQLLAALEQADAPKNTR